MSPRVASLRNRITVQQDTGTTRDAVGGTAANWTTYAQRWSEVDPLGGSEGFRAEQFEAEVDHVFTMRWDTTTKAITPNMRISYDSRLFDIQAVINVDERDRWIRLLAKEVQ